MPVTAPEETLAVLLTTLRQCRRRLSAFSSAISDQWDLPHELWTTPQVEIDEVGPLEIRLTNAVQVMLDADNETFNMLYFLVRLRAEGERLEISGYLAVEINVVLGDLPEGEHRILTVHEGDLSFSEAMTRLGSVTEELCSRPDLIGTVGGVRR